ncbi:MAG: SUMF1/EgtB/PvdO family nonheme iron enzyme, partial [bacterium]|nr:SUMF1/EgtB/PvdO family nonheme iron enzyme [bacterium]
ARNGAFGWDNEFEQLRVEVTAFAVGKHKVTNGDYMRFVQDGTQPPFFWSQRKGEWRLRTMFGEIRLPLDWPVWVTRHEAQAYAKAAGKSLPTEAQLDRAGYASPEVEYRPYPWGAGESSPDRGNFDFHGWDPVPVTANPRGDSAYGVSQILGNGWEWTADLFRPLPGFEQFDFYPGYSANFFDDDHYVIKGGSPRTAAKLLRRSFRNWFRQGYKYVYCGFRVVG